MRLTKLSVGVSTTFNMGHFESIRPSIEVEAEIEPGESLEEVYTKLYAAARPLFLKTTILEANAMVSRREQFGVGDPYRVIEWAKLKLGKLVNG